MKKVIELRIENAKNTLKEEIESVYNDAISKTGNIIELTEILRNKLPQLLIGRGGSHIWISDTLTKERYAIIYF